MFLGPIEQFKPWNTNGIDGVFKFLRKFWNLYHNEAREFYVSSGKAGNEELKVLHRTIKKTQEDIERLSFNTSVSEFMICVNELSALKCNKYEILEPLAIVVSPYAPHIAEEIWHKLGHTTSITQASFPLFDEKYLVEDSYEYPISVNGKMRAKMNFPLDMAQDEITEQVLSSEVIRKWMEGKEPKKVIVVPKKIVNVVV
jgi:leucyl-tRNA synthetase